MAYWWVNQGKTYKEEKEGSFLWAPKKGKNENTPFHWLTMYSVKEGDIVFSYANGYIKAFSSVIKEALTSDKPFDTNAERLWEKDGNKIDLLFNELANPISLNEINVELLKLSPTQYSPINSLGKVNQGYLYSLTDNAGKFLLDTIELKNNIVIEENFVSNLNDSITNETIKEQIVKSRIGQGEFRKRIINKWNGKCSVSKCNLTEILIASHIKPWKYSNNFERLDENNGLLLSPTYDKLFDKGYISFKDNGMLIISSSLNETTIKDLKIELTDKLLINLNQEQQKYLAFHRDSILK
jgi:hypothetical protein